MSKRPREGRDSSPELSEDLGANLLSLCLRGATAALEVESEECPSLSSLSLSTIGRLLLLRESGDSDDRSTVTSLAGVAGPRLIAPMSEDSLESRFLFGRPGVSGTRGDFAFGNVGGLTGDE